MNKLSSPLNLIFLLAFMLSSVINIQAQERLFAGYDWEKDPKLHSLSPAMADEPEIYTKIKVVMEYVKDPELEYAEYYILHHIVRVNSDDAVERNNRIYLPLNRVKDILTTKARVIKKDGSVQELDAGNIQEGIDEESGTRFRYFAIEGAEVGCEIEYLFHFKREPIYSGVTVNTQWKFPAMNVSLDVVSPWNLGLAFQTYNGLPEMEQDSTVDDHNHYKLHLDSVAGLKPEQESAYRANMKKVIYKFDSNLQIGRSNLFSYNSISGSIYSSIYDELSKKEAKSIRKLIKEIDIDSRASDEQKIRKVENYIKLNFAVFPNRIDEIKDLEMVLENKIADKHAATKLFANMFKELDIAHDLVITCDRFNTKFDPDFESYNFLIDELFYFPGVDKYMAPYHTFSRLGFVPSKLVHNYGLFINKSGGDVKFIEAPAYDQTKDEIFLKADLSDDPMNPVFELDHRSFGYYAQGIQPYFHLLDEKGREKAIESSVKFLTEDMEITQIEAENNSVEMYGVEPMIVKAKFTSGSFMQKAGNKYIFKVGELIGPQLEMYQQTRERVLDVESDYGRYYHREITFNVPDGYKVSNLESLNFDVHYKDEGDTTMAFISTYSVNGNEIKVVIDEYYKQVVYPVEIFEEYRKVINAAADFNKAVVFLEKE